MNGSSSRPSVPRSTSSKPRSTPAMPPRPPRSHGDKELTMTNQPPANRPPRRGGHWVVAAVTTPLAPLLLGASLLANNGWHGCGTRAGAHPACSSSIWTALATLGFWVVALAFTVGGLGVGLVEGWTRRRFAHGRWLSMTVVGLCAP